ncbi:MAG: hypothetical protein QNI90_15870 [Dinoroseobacter sp.]|nr:hypothetical protein [Dinoroseobacter sp.]
MTWMELISEAELTFGFINGQGLGSLLLAVVLLAFIYKQKSNNEIPRKLARHFTFLIGRQR